MQITVRLILNIDMMNCKTRFIPLKIIFLIHKPMRCLMWNNCFNQYIYIQNQTLKRFFALMFLFLCLQPGIAAQTPYDSMDFSVVDSFVLSVKYQNDISKLAFDLTDRFPDDIDKTRAIFKWITNNIAFDFRFINRGKEIEKPDCYGDDACPSILIKWEKPRSSDSSLEIKKSNCRRLCKAL